MTSLSLRLGLATFVVLSGALATNMFVLQPPGRGLQTASLREDRDKDGAASWAGQRPSQPRSQPDGNATARDVPPVAATTPDVGGGGVELTRAIQRELRAKGYETGSVDGVTGLVTRAAIMAYQADTGLALTGEPEQGLLQQIVLGSAGEEPAVGTKPGPQAETVTRFVQRALTQLGYAAGSLSGAMSAETSAAIRKFEASQKLKVTGRVSGEVVAKLMALTGQTGVADAR